MGSCENCKTNFGFSWKSGKLVRISCAVKLKLIKFRVTFQEELDYDSIPLIAVRFQYYISDIIYDFINTFQRIICTPKGYFISITTSHFFFVGCILSSLWFNPSQNWSSPVKFKIHVPANGNHIVKKIDSEEMESKFMVLKTVIKQTVRGSGFFR